MSAPEKKSGLQKKVSSIFQGMPGLEAADPSALPQSAADLEVSPPPAANISEPAPPNNVPASPGCSATEEFLNHLREQASRPREFEAYAAYALNPGTARTRIGVDLGERQYKLLRLGKHRRLEAIACHEWTGSPDAVASKEIRDGVLRELVQKIQAGQAASVMGLPGEAVSYQVLKLPPLEHSEMVKALRWELTKKGLVDTGHSLVDYILMRGKSADRKASVLAVAARESEVSERVRMGESAGLFMEDVQSTVQAIERIVREGRLFPAREDGAVLDFGYTTSTLCFFRGAELRYARTFAIGGKECIAAVKGVMKADGQTFALSEDDAHAWQRQVGMPTEDDLRNHPAKALLGQVAARMRPVVEDIAQELRRSLEFYAGDTGFGPVGTLQLSGGMALTKNLDACMSREIGIPVKVLRPFDALGITVPPPWKDAQAMFTVALGLAMDGGIHLDLLPKNNRWQVRERKAMRWTKVAAGAMVAGILFVGAGLQFWSGVLQKRLDALNQTIAQLCGPATKCKKILELQKTIREREQLILGNAMRQPVWEGILKEISNAIPDNVVLTEMALMPHNVPKTMRLVGLIYADNLSVDSQLSTFQKKMTYSPYFGSFELSMRKNIPGASPAASTFEIYGVLQY